MGPVTLGGSASFSPGGESVREGRELVSAKLSCYSPASYVEWE